MSGAENSHKHVFAEESIFNEERLNVSKNTSFEELEPLVSPQLENESVEGFERNVEIKGEESHEEENFELLGENSSLTGEIGDHVLSWIGGGNKGLKAGSIFGEELSKNDGLRDGALQVTSKLSDKESPGTVASADKKEPELYLASIRLEQNICMKSRMRQWLNRDRRQQPVTGFLGMKYVDIEMDAVDAVCQKLLCPSTDNEQVEAKAIDNEWKAQKSAGKKTPLPKLCSCFLKEPQTMQLELCKCGREIKHGAGKAIRGLKKRRTQYKRQFMRDNKKRTCNCHKTIWIFNRYPQIRRKTENCFCDRLNVKRKRFLRTMIKKRIKELDSIKIEIEEKLRCDKIKALLKKIDPETASHFAVENKTQKKRPKPNGFIRMVRKKFGIHLRGYMMEKLGKGILRQGYNTNETQTGFQYIDLPNGSVYYGQFSPLGMEGKCVYGIAHGPVFHGSMVGGKMEGPGKLFYSNGGTIEGVWVSGSLFSPKYSFSDGLEFKSKGWIYCRMPDRRFFSEILDGMNSPDNVQLCADHPARQIPVGCLEAGQGFYDPKKKAIIHSSTGKIVRIIREEEGNWIMQNCRREQFEEVPFSRYMYENWYPGTVFTPPNDEPEWFEQEFPRLALPYSTIDDVVEARRMMIQSATETSEQNLV